MELPLAATSAASRNNLRRRLNAHTEGSSSQSRGPAQPHGLAHDLLSGRLRPELPHAGAPQAHPPLVEMAHSVTGRLPGRGGPRELRRPRRTTLDTPMAPNGPQCFPRPSTFALCPRTSGGTLLPWPTFHLPARASRACATRPSGRRAPVNLACMQFGGLSLGLRRP